MQPDNNVPAEVVGASEKEIVLGKSSQTAYFKLSPSRRSPSPAAVERTGPQRVYLIIDNVTADGPPSTSYRVILDMGTPDEPRDDYRVGLVGLFGINKAYSVEGSGMPHGMRFAFEVTDVVERLKQRGLWNEDDIRVTFEPVEEGDDEDATEVKVGRVSISYE